MRLTDEAIEEIGNEWTNSINALVESVMYGDTRDAYRHRDAALTLGATTADIRRAINRGLRNRDELRRSGLLSGVVR